MNLTDLQAAHRAMAMSRAIEGFCVERSPHWYAGIGEEATVVGTFIGLGEADFAVPHYRGMLVVPWLRGRPLEDVLGCVVQRRSSPTLGRLYGAFAGSLDRGVMPYVTMVLGPNLGVAVGAALAFQQRGEPRIVVASLGDGTAGTGDFHESLNLAACLRLPCVFVCQNNQFSISTSTAATLAGESIADWAARYGIASRQIDGNDVEAVYDAVAEAAVAARAGGGPSFVEALTYRQLGHFAGDPAAYRSAEEHERWVARDPIVRVQEKLRERGVPDGEVACVQDEIDAALRVAAEKLARQPPLTPADLAREDERAHV